MRKLLCLGLLGILVLSACRPAEGWVEESPLPSSTPIDTGIENDQDAPVVAESVETKTVPREITPTPRDEPQPETAEIDCGEIFCTLTWTDWLERPIGEGLTRTIDRSYPYGSTGDGKFDPHHGVEFQNRSGTSVLAAHGGEVIFAGMDDATRLGPFGGFYGNVVVLRHPDLPGYTKEIFTLYAHLSEIRVELGELVDMSEEIGRVGATGAADGPHLHFETRVDINDYAHTVNPVLWFAPLDDADHQETAVLAGLIMDRGGNPVTEFPLTLEKISATGEVEAYYYPETYYPVGMNAHPMLNENFAVPDISAGNYRLAFISGRLYEFFFTLEPGALGFIKVQLD